MASQQCASAWGRVRQWWLKISINSHVLIPSLPKREGAAKIHIYGWLKKTPERFFRNVNSPR
jgi:hypothetical protein